MRNTNNERGHQSDIPPAVDAFDGLEEQEKPTDAQVEEALASTVNQMNLQLGKTGRHTTLRKPGKGDDRMLGRPIFQQGDGSGIVHMDVLPEAMKVLQAA
jgi:hypothetical protein